MFEKGKPNPGRKFQPGVSGNPGGRPKGLTDLAAAAREDTTEALNTVRAVMRNKDANPAVRLAAAVALLERGWGKAPQTVNLVHENADLKDLSDAELMVIAAGGRNGSGSTPPGTEEGSGQPH